MKYNVPLMKMPETTMNKYTQIILLHNNIRFPK